MEEAVKQLEKQGWRLSIEKLRKRFERTENGNEDAERRFHNNPAAWILDQDLHDVGSPCLPDGLNSGKTSHLPTPLCLQVKAVTVVSAPKHNPESGAAPRMLKVALTDGKSTCYGIEYEPIPKISPKTPPGTKVCLLGTIKVSNGLIFLDHKNLQIIGGEVADLLESWKIEQMLLYHVRSTNQGADGPPPWVPFGRRIQPINIKDKGEKTLEEEKVVRDEVFLNQRQDAIAAAVDHGCGVNKIVKGSGRQMDVQQPERRGRGRGRRERSERGSRDDERAAKPRDSIRLFEFLQPQIETEQDALRVEEFDEELESVGNAAPSWERDGIYRPPNRGRDRFSEHRGGYGDPMRGGGYSDASFRGGRESHRGRGGPRQDRREGPRARGDSRQGGRGRGRRGSYRDNNYSERRGYEQERASPVEALVEDFSSWPGLEVKEPAKPSAPVAAVKVQNQWAVEDYCLAKWEASDQYFPAVIQQLLPNRKSVTVVFVESGDVRIVETKNLRRDPQDQPSHVRQPDPNPTGTRGMTSTRIYTPRSRGRF